MPMNTARSNFEVSKIEQNLIVSGGITHDGNTTNDCEMFIPQQERWAQFPAMVKRR